MSKSLPRLLVIVLLVPVLAAAWLLVQTDHSKNTSTSADFSVPDESIIERGRYLAVAGNCATCHTAPGGEFMAGGLAFETPFGTIYSTNITPDAETGIGNWTGVQFLNSMRHGVRPDGEHLYPVFPYTAFTKVTDEDVAALYAYFQGIPAVRREAPENQLSFPFNQRSLMAFWKGWSRQ